MPARRPARPRIFITQPVAKSAIARLRRVATVKVNPDASRVIGRHALIAAVRECDILFCLLHDRIDAGVIAASPRLRLIAAQSVTPSHIDMEEATTRRIPVTVVPVLQTETTADIAFGLMLAVARRVVEGDRLVRAGKFPGAQSAYLLGSLVWGKTIGLIGGGGLIGKAVARRARGFDMRVLYWTPRRIPEHEEREASLTYVALDQLLRESDFVSLHSPLNKETRHQIGARELKLMKKTAYLINTARGPIVDEAALVRALERKQSPAPASMCSSTSRRSARRCGHCPMSCSRRTSAARRARRWRTSWPTTSPSSPASGRRTASTRRCWTVIPLTPRSSRRRA